MGWLGTGEFFIPLFDTFDQEVTDRLFELRVLFGENVPRFLPGTRHAVELLRDLFRVEFEFGRPRAVEGEVRDEVEVLAVRFVENNEGIPSTLLDDFLQDVVGYAAHGWHISTRTL